MGNYFFNDERMNIARGLLKGVSDIHKFGAVGEMAVNTTGSVWDVDDTLYPWTAFASASAVTVDRANASDADKVITIEGLDENYELVTDTCTLTNASGNTTDSGTTFIRVFRAFVSTGVTNVGNIDIKVSTTVVARITASLGQTLMAIYTIPAGYTGYLMRGVMTVAANADATGNMYIRYFGQDAFRIGHTFEVAGTGGPYDYEFSVPQVIPAKSDIDVRATVRSNNARATAAFDIILKAN
jgi:hypothetical protein